MPAYPHQPGHRPASPGCPQPAITPEMAGRLVTPDARRVEPRPVAALAGTGRLADDLYLIAHDDRTGRPRLQPRAAGLGLAGGLLAELVLAGRIVIAGDTLAAAGGPDPGDRLARLVLGQLAGEPRRHETGDWLEFLARTAVADVAGRLAQAGYLGWRPARRPRRGGRWVPASPSCAFTALARAAGALHPARPLTAPGASLAAMAAACGLGRLVTEHATPGARSLEDTAVFLPPALQYLTARTREAVDSALLAHQI
jgi:Golgi phosphoprotein 3 (GPP34)